MTMHVPDKVSCHVNWRVPRMAKAILLKEPCRAFTSVEALEKINGRACDGCARCPFREIAVKVPFKP